MSMFDTFDRTGVAEFAFPREVVFKAVEKAVSVVSGMSISNSSPSAGFLEVKAGMSALSWGENIKISVLTSGPWSAKVEIASVGKTNLGSSWTHSKNQKNVRELIHATASILDQNGDTWVKELNLVPPKPRSESNSSSSVADELRKLAELRDEGIITSEEFDKHKNKLLNP